MILNKYLVALLQVLLLFVAALQAALTDGLTLTEGVQLAALFVGACVTYYVKILDAGWAGALKVAGALIGAVLAAVVPFLTEGWTDQAIVIVIFAAINALATQFGVDIRVDSSKEIVARNAGISPALAEVDPKAAAAAESSMSWPVGT